jgi:hypothetical protein
MGKKLPKVNNHSEVENSPNLVTLACQSDWANFRLLGDCFHWAIFFKLRKGPKILGHFFSQGNSCVWKGRIFGRFQ